MLNAGAAELGSNFTANVFLSNGSLVTKNFNLPTSFGVSNPYAESTLTIDGYYPSYGLIDRLRAGLRTTENIPTRFILCANPAGPAHYWIFNRYINA